MHDLHDESLKAARNQDQVGYICPQEILPIFQRRFSVDPCCNHIGVRHKSEDWNRARVAADLREILVSGVRHNMVVHYCRNQI